MYKIVVGLTCILLLAAVFFLGMRVGFKAAHHEIQSRIAVLCSHGVHLASIWIEDSSGARNEYGVWCGRD